MRTEQILYLDAIYRCSSLHKASETLHISTQALSLSIRTLEKEMDFTILERSRTGVSLTDKGQKLLKVGIQFLHQIEYIQEKQTKKFDSTLTGILDIMATSGVIETFFPPLTSQLLSDYPKFRLKLISCDFDEMISNWEAYTDTELGFIFQPSVDGRSLTPYDATRFAFHPLFSGVYKCIIPDNFPIAHYKTISLNTMAKYPLVFFSPMSSILLNLFSNTSSQEVVFADSFAIYKQLLKDGKGLSITFIPDDSDTPTTFLPNLKIVPFKEHIDNNLGILYSKDAVLSPKASAFIEYLTDYIQKTPPSNLLIS